MAFRSWEGVRVRRRSRHLLCGWLRCSARLAWGSEIDDGTTLWKMERIKVRQDFARERRDTE